MPHTQSGIPIHGLSIKLDYWRIKLDDLVVQQAFQQVLSREVEAVAPILARDGCGASVIQASLALLVIRDTLSCDLKRIKAEYVNAGSITTDGVDASITYDWTLGSLGDMRWSFDGAHIIQYQFDGDLSASCGIDDNRQTRISCDIAGLLNRNAPTRRPLPQWKWNSSVAWQGEGQRAIFTWRYISSYKSDWSNNLIIGAKIKQWNVFDFTYSRDIQDTYQVTFGITNMFDSDPSRANGFDLQYDSRTHDPLGRRFFAAVRYAFN